MTINKLARSKWLLGLFFFRGIDPKVNSITKIYSINHSLSGKNIWNTYRPRINQRNEYFSKLFIRDLNCINKVFLKIFWSRKITFNEYPDNLRPKYLKKNFIYAIKIPDKKTKEKNFVSMINPGYQIRVITRYFLLQIKEKKIEIGTYKN